MGKDLIIFDKSFLSCRIHLFLQNFLSLSKRVKLWPKRVKTKPGEWQENVCVIFINIIVIRNFALLCRVFFFFHQAHRPSSYNGNLNCTSTAAQSWPGSAPAHIRHSSHPASTHPTQEAWCGYWGTPGYRYKELFKLWFSLYVRVKTIVIKAWIYDDCYPGNNTIYVELLLVHESLKNFTIKSV